MDGWQKTVQLRFRSYEFKMRPVNRVMSVSFFLFSSLFSAAQEQAGGSENRVRCNQCGDILGENTE